MVRAGAARTCHLSGTPHIARAPLSMDKLSYLPSQGTVSCTSDFNPANGDTIKVWDACDFIAAATLFIRRAAAVAARARYAVQGRDGGSPPGLDPAAFN